VDASLKVEVVDDDKEETGLTFDDTSEFVRAVGSNQSLVKPKPEPKEIPVPNGRSESQRSPSREQAMVSGDIALDELEAGEVRIKDEEDEDYDMAMMEAVDGLIRSVEAEGLATDQDKSSLEDGVGTSSEQTFSTGMASTLSILRQQGIIAQPSAELGERERRQLERDRFVADQRLRDAQREIDRLQSRGSNKDQAQREYENRLREQQDARDKMEAFKDYKPDVNIVYYDEFGRALTPKEAWKALSHKFHGKGSGKMKTEKRLKKIAEEKKKEAMASGDTPLSMNKAFQQRQEKAGQAHFVLSVGNRG